jgi:hypothetical protein
VAIDYKIVKTDNTFKAIRQGDFQYVFYDKQHRPKKDLTPKEVGVKVLMTRRLGKMFEPEMVGEGFFFSGKLKKVGKMLPVDVQSNDGWLTIAWQRAQTDQKLE